MRGGCWEQRSASVTQALKSCLQCKAFVYLRVSLVLTTLTSGSQEPLAWVGGLAFCVAICSLPRTTLLAVWPRHAEHTC